MEREKNETPYISNSLKSKRSNYLTPVGLAKFQSQLAELQSIRQLKLLEHTPENINLDNLSYDSLDNELTLIDRAIFRLERLTSNNVLITKQPNDMIVAIGDTIRIEIEGEIREIIIVGTAEADPNQNLISNESPVGKSILGRKIGETVEVITTNQTFPCKIISIVR